MKISNQPTNQINRPQQTFPPVASLLLLLLDKANNSLASKGIVSSQFSILTLWACQVSLLLLYVIKYFSTTFRWLCEKNKLKQCFTLSYFLGTAGMVITLILAHILGIRHYPQISYGHPSVWRGHRTCYRSESQPSFILFRKELHMEKHSNNRKIKW